MARPTSDPAIDDNGRVMSQGKGESKVPNNRCGGSCPMTLPPTNAQQLDGQPVNPEQAPTDPGEELFDEEEMVPDVPHDPSRRVHGAEDIWEKYAAQVGMKPTDSTIVPQLEVEPVVYEKEFHPYDPPRYRLCGKQAGNSELQQPPALRVSRAGGECCLSEGLKLLQHQGFKELIQEEASRVQDGGAVSLDPMVLQEVHQSVIQLESELTAMSEVQQERARLKSMKVEEEEVLQTQTIGLDVVRQNLQDWIPAFRTEVESILSTGAMEVISDAKYRELLVQHPDLERLPMLAVATKKPPNKRKGRVVVCGNQSSKQIQPGEPDPSVGGIDTVGIRCIVNLAAQRSLSIASLDVKGAFLQAPRRSAKLRPTVCDPPSLIKQMGLSGATDKWLVHKALYGFTESPSDWSAFRNDTMRALRWQANGLNMQLQQTAEPHVWRVRGQDDLDGPDYGYVAVYVDDLLIAVTGEHIHQLIDAFRRAWNCSDPEFVTPDQPMRFCGFEITKTSEGFQMGQEGFATEMLRRRQVSGVAKFPLPSIRDEEDEMPVDLEAVKKAQGIVGELNWLTTRSRPDLAYSVGVLARLLHRRPLYVLELCDHVLKYANATKDLGLEYSKCGPGNLGEKEELQVAKGLDTLQIFSDASFGPIHERCKSVSGCLVEHAGGVVAWDSQTQPFISQSTAEAEVISYNLAYQVGEGVSSLLQELGFSTSKQLYGDSKSGIAVVANECGPWRTRHLRLRSSKLRELIQNPEEPWSIRHLSGQLLVADGLTKGLVYQAFEKFKGQLRMQPMQKSVEALVRKVEVQLPEEKLDFVLKILGVIGGILCGSNFVKSGILLVLVVFLLEASRKKRLNQETKDQLRPVEDRVSDGPKVRAFRVLRTGGASTEGEPERSHSAAAGAEQRGKGARTRGRDAMAMHDLAQGLGGLRISTEVTVNVNVPSGEEAARQRASTTSGEEAPRQRASTTSGGAMRQQRSTTSGEGEIRGQSSNARDGYGRGASERPQDMEVWNRARFQQAPRGADQWQVDLISEGWLVRTHGSKGRVRPFHPLHRSCPLPGHELEGDRITVVFDYAGGYEVLADRWTQQRTWQRPGPWRGYTLLRVTPQSSSVIHGAEETSEVSDGSYECVASN